MNFLTNIACAYGWATVLKESEVQDKHLRIEYLRS